MSDTMRTLPIGNLLERMITEYRRERSVFGLHEYTWYRKPDDRTVDILGESAGTALGPAAGPHTQLAQNIVAAYLTGSRCIELKTVQILDELEIEKPCIAAPDEGYNTEWSTELSLQSAWEEYAKAWILLHLVEELWDLRGPVPAASGKPAALQKTAPRTFLFTMSVGYNLEGIRNPRMQQYIDRMIDSSGEELFHDWIAEAEGTLGSLLTGTDLEHRIPAVATALPSISGRMCQTVTLSTMHGCPPEEIEAICRHLLVDKKLHTYVKLNPTLPGYESVGSILDQLGYGYVELDRDGFAQDLSWDRAVPILHNLRRTAGDAGRQFGVKLTNTLAVVNRASQELPGGLALPGEQKYLSGRALFPLAITVAARVAREFHGTIPISFSGGITAHNVAEVFRTGIRPITACTVFLKPGGYTRQVQLAQAIDGVACWDPPDTEPPVIDVAALTALAAQTLRDATLRKQFRGTREITVPGPLPRHDCYRAPCVEACPIGQHVPEYIRLVGEGRYGEALELIYEQNALPGITGYICDHACQHNCTRLDYEGCLNIRELKKIAFLNGKDRETRTGPSATAGLHTAGLQTSAADRADSTDHPRCAVIGAGPAGLSTAYFLARRGVPVTVFEREASAGGVVRHGIPPFRLPQEAIEEDVRRIRELGVEFRFGANPEITPDELRREGFGPVVLAVGAEIDNALPLEGDKSRVIPSLEFLWACRSEPHLAQASSVLGREIGSRIVVVGGGNTAMDAARTAIRLDGVTQVTVLYRRTEHEMPADREEYDNARTDGVQFRFLRNPEQIGTGGELTVRVMELGDRDASGRRRPVSTERTESMQADTVIAAIGERVDSKVLDRFGVRSGRETPETAEAPETTVPDVYLVGDARTGPSTVVRCVAAGRRAAEMIIGNHHDRAVPAATTTTTYSPERARQILERKACIRTKPDTERWSDAETFSRREYDRCLECGDLCNRCVEVCPNRANITVTTTGDPRFQDPFQIVHLDSLCNECGNCAQFCPWEKGVPYRDKPTVFNTSSDFENSTNDGWLLMGDLSGDRSRDPDFLYRFDGEAREISRADLRRFGTASSASAGSAESRFLSLLDRLVSDRPDLFRRLDRP